MSMLWCVLLPALNLACAYVAYRLLLWLETRDEAEQETTND